MLVQERNSGKRAAVAVLCLSRTRRYSFIELSVCAARGRHGGQATRALYWCVAGDRNTLTSHRVPPLFGRGMMCCSRRARAAGDDQLYGFAALQAVQ